MVDARSRAEINSTDSYCVNRECPGELRRRLCGIPEYIDCSATTSRLRTDEVLKVVDQWIAEHLWTWKDGSKCKCDKEFIYHG